MSGMKCKFCGDEFRGMRALKEHVADEHPEKARAIAESLPVVPEGEIRFGGRYGGITGLGTEFRKRMGYSSKDGNGPLDDDKEK